MLGPWGGLTLFNKCFDQIKPFFQVHELYNLYLIYSCTIHLFVVPEPDWQGPSLIFRRFSSMIPLDLLGEHDIPDNV